MVADWRLFLYPQLTAKEFLANADDMREFRGKMQSLFMCHELTDEMLAVAILTTEPSPEAMSLSATGMSQTVHQGDDEPPSACTG
jgi:hypothetical protein